MMTTSLLGKVRLILFALFGVSLAYSLVAQQAGTRSSDEELVYSLSVMRHGVRSPTADPAQYNRFSSAPWPAWSVPPGNLTRHGYELVRLLGAYDREDLAHHGLLAAQGCGDAAKVSAHADSDERTRETARAMLEGMFPGCNIPFRAKDEGQNDPLFHLAPGSVTPEQARLGASAVLAKVGGDPANVASAYHAPLAALDNMLATCGAKLKTGRTSLFSIPATIAPGNGDHVVEMRGPINTASTLSEIMLLEYAEGMPMQDVGWGCVDGSKLREVIGLHTDASELLLRTPAVAGPQASALLHAIGASLEQAARQRPIPGAEGKPGDKLLLLVGHDTNLTNIAGALQLDWLIDGRRNDTPPGSALIFQLWRQKKSGEQSVRVFFTTQTLEQMRDARPLNLTEPPPRVPVFMPGCSRVDGACSLDAFSRMLKKSGY